MENLSDLPQIFNAFNALRSLVIGDVMIDGYLWGKVDRISPEAPVPIVQVTKKENRLGGAANVALNIAALGATPIICSVVGDDEKGNEFYSLLKKKGMDTSGIVKSKKRPTTVKTRIISHHQQVVRVDEELTEDLNAEEEQNLLAVIRQKIQNEKIDLIIFEDYNKGVLTSGIIEAVINLAREKNIPTAVDPKKNNFFSYKNVTLFKPNLKELREGLKIDLENSSIEELSSANNLLFEKINNAISVITLSEKGVFYSSEEGSEIIPAHKRDIADVSGAGDTVISVAGLCLALHLPHRTIANLSNLAGGLVCEKIGVVPIEKEQLLNEAIRLRI